MNNSIVEHERLCLIEYLRKARSLYIFTGAGISTDSGIPDYRGPTGVWKNRRPIEYDSFMNSHEARVKYWEYKLEWWQNNRDAQPNMIHKAIVALEKAGKLQMVVTQNIDGLHSLAGLPSDKLVELHGTNWLVECQGCGISSEPEKFFEEFVKTRMPPICTCGGFLKPATISFGQSLRFSDLEKAKDATLQADCVLALGSTLAVYPAASFPLIAAKRDIPSVVSG